MMRRKKFQINPNIGVGTVKAHVPAATQEKETLQEGPADDASPVIESRDQVSNEVECLAEAPSSSKGQSLAVAIEESVDRTDGHVAIPDPPMIATNETFRPPISKRCSVVPSENDNTSVADASENGSEVAADDVRTAGGKKRRRSAIKLGEELDTKKFTLADLIDWRPATENTLRKKWDEKKQQLLNKASATTDIMIPSSMSDFKQPAGPRVKINEQGDMVLDEESLLVVENPDNNAWETVHDDLLPKKLNCMSFRKHHRTSQWGVLETDLFYVPTRSRAELKKKFNREEKSDEDRVNEILSKPTLLDATLYERVKKISKKMEDEQNEKAAKKAAKEQRATSRAIKKGKKPA